MNSLQAEALHLASDGHNICLAGQAETGKTYTVQRMHEELTAKGKCTSITCTTGMACMQYYGLSYDRRATTIHSWSGLHDGRYLTSQLIHLLDSNEKFSDCKQNILKTDVLIIDEMSMLSRTLFEQLEAVCRSVRKSDLAFGGMQVIGVGDFYQLPPVPSLEYGDAGEFCIRSEVWDKYFPHHINLTEVVRQEEADLANAVSELARGETSRSTNELMTELSQPLSDHIKSTKLFARNIDVDFHNDQMFSAENGEVFSFTAEDVGSHASLKSIGVQKLISLKKGCPVVLGSEFGATISECIARDCDWLG